MTNAINPLKSPLVLFDGVCNYCNSMVNFAIRNDKKAKLKFAPIQSVTGRHLIQQFNIPSHVDSVIFLENDRYYTYSTAAIRIAKYLDWPARILFALIIIPAFIRQPLYKWIAKNRYRWFGKRESCMVPRGSVRDRFLVE